MATSIVVSQESSSGDAVVISSTLFAATCGLHFKVDSLRNMSNDVNKDRFYRISLIYRLGKDTLQTIHNPSGLVFTGFMIGVSFAKENFRGPVTSRRFIPK